MSDYDRFGAYQVYECLGAGGMATVHRAEIELEDGGTLEVALKRLLPQLADDKVFIDDFVREAKLVSQLQHPNIVRILELGRVNRIYFIAMELVRGQPLMALMRRSVLQKRPVPIGAVLSVAREICSALEYAHDSTDELHFPRRIVHRDLTPSNVLIDDDGHVKVIDFGVAKALTGLFQTSSGLAKGKLGYMSLEAISGKDIDARADVFSLGIVLWELLTGKRLFKGDNDDVVLAKIREGNVRAPSQLRGDCPSELDELVLRALANDREERWASAAAMGAVLDEVMRAYGEDAMPDAVASWKHALRRDSMTVRSVDGESTQRKLSAEDLDQLIDSVEPPDAMGEGSRRLDSEPSVQIQIEPVPFQPVEYDAASDTLDQMESFVSWIERKPGRITRPLRAVDPPDVPEDPFSQSQQGDTVPDQTQLDETIRD